MNDNHVFIFKVHRHLISQHVDYFNNGEKANENLVSLTEIFKFLGMETME